MSTTTVDLTYDALYDLYVTQDLTPAEISARVGLGTSRVGQLLRTHGIAPKTKHGGPPKLADMPTGVIVQAVIENGRERAADLLDVSVVTLVCEVGRRGLDIRALSQERGRMLARQRAATATAVEAERAAQEAKRQAAMEARIARTVAVFEQGVEMATEIAARIGIGNDTVRHHLNAAGYPVHPCSHCGRRTRRKDVCSACSANLAEYGSYDRPRGYGGDPDVLVAANRARTTTAAARTVEAARRALRHADDLPSAWRNALAVRVEHPTASLADVGAMLGMSKDSYSGMLRRALSASPVTNGSGSR